jgi:hypothetical protein
MSRFLWRFTNMTVLLDALGISCEKIQPETGAMAGAPVAESLISRDGKQIAV